MVRARKKPAPRRAPDESKSEATRRHLLERALVLFRDRGVEATTMRDVAKAAGLSVGAAYYYFPSKEALVFAYYADNEQEMEAIAATTTGSLRERLGRMVHGKLESIRPQRKMLAAIVPRLANPSDPLSAFSAQTRDVRSRAIATFATVLREADVDAANVQLLAHALWLFLLATMLLYVNDDSPGGKRTHGLVDDALDMIVPMLPLLSTPIGRSVVDRVAAALDRAGIAVL